MSNIQAEGIDEVKMREGTTFQSKTALAELREESSASVAKLWYEHNIAASRRHKLLAYICHVVEACKERKFMVDETFLKLHKSDDDRGKVTVDAHVAYQHGFGEKAPI